MHIKYCDLAKQWEVVEPSLTPKLMKFFRSGDYMNPEIKNEFENKFVETLFPDKNVEAVGVSNGTTALRIALECLELQGSTCVVMPTNTFISNAMVCTQLGYEIKLVDFDCYYQMSIYELEDFLRFSRDAYRNVVIMAVHLTGLPCNLSAIIDYAEKYGCYVIEDCSQAHGTIYKGHVPVGVLGHINTFSCYPTKNLGAIGEAGVITSSNPEYITRARAKTRTGSYSPDNPHRASILGNNDRIDALQCLIMIEKLKHLHDWNKQKREVVNLYGERVDTSLVVLPETPNYSDYHSYHTFTVALRQRKKIELTSLDNIKHRTNYELATELRELGIETKINYNPFIHKVPFYSYLNRKFPYADSIQDYIINLPLHPFMDMAEVDYVCTMMEKCLVK